MPGESHVGEDNHARKAARAGAVPTRNRNLRIVSLSTCSPAGAPAGANAASEGSQLPANPNSATQCSPNGQSPEPPAQGVTRGCMTKHSGNLCPLFPFPKILRDTTHYRLRGPECRGLWTGGGTGSEQLAAARGHCHDQNSPARERPSVLLDVRNSGHEESSVSNTPRPGALTVRV